MPIVRALPVATHRLFAGLLSIGVLALAIDHALAVPWMEGARGPASAPAAAGHLVVSEVMTGGTSASDEFIELYNPTATLLPLEGLEVVYVTASGATMTRKASWAAGATGVPPGAHLLVTNGGGIFAGVADVSYANGLAATGGSVALRTIGAAAAIDAVGWGNAASTWLETQPAPAPPAGSSLERLPGGSAGSGQDTDDNLLDFVVQPVPDPQNSASAGIPGPSPSPGDTASASPTTSPTTSATSTASPTAEPTATASTSQTPSTSPTPTPTLTPTATPVPTPSPTPVPMTIAQARAEPDGAMVTVEGVSLTSGDFTDGGGYLVDEGAGIAVLVADWSFARGELLRVSGTVDDRYAQRTIRATADSIASLGTGSEPLPLDATTGSIGEALEGRLVEVSGVISSGVTTLSAGLAWDVDDGSGASRILIGTATGVDTTSWTRGVGLTVIGVVGQRDSTGTGASGFRIQPRDPLDILSVEPVATPSPSPTPDPTLQPTATPAPSLTPSPTAIPSAPLLSISEARAAATGTHLRVRGVVTAPSGLIEVGSAVVQDASGAILVRMGTDVGTLSLGQLVELDATRATKAGMLSLRVSTGPQYLGTQADPEPLRRATGALGEAEEARLVILRGAISSAISRARAGTVSFAIDDGSGPLRVTISPRSGISTAALTRGAWLELRGVLAQETTGSAPSSGYRLWPRIPADLHLLATPVAGGTATTCCAANAPSNAGSPPIPSGTNRDDVIAQGAGRAPSLARPQATGSPRPLATTGSAVAPAGDLTAPAGGILVSGMGLAALAGLAAWFGRRRGPDDHQPMAEQPAEPAEALEAARGLPPPRLSVLRSEASDARKERRILPPT